MSSGRMEDALRPVRLSSAHRRIADVRRRCLADVYVRHRGLLVASAQGLLGCRARAEDVVQDAFLKLWEQGPAEGIEDDGKYLFRVVRNLAIDRLRRLALEQRYGASEELAEQVPAAISPERSVLGREALQQLVGALNELSPRMRRVFTLSQLEGHSQREVARSIGVSPTLVNFLLRDTLGHCRLRLEDGSIPACARCACPASGQQVA